MYKIGVPSICLGILACIAVAAATIPHTAKTNPVGHVSTAHVAVHGISLNRGARR